MIRNILNRSWGLLSLFIVLAAVFFIFRNCGKENPVEAKKDVMLVKRDSDSLLIYRMNSLVTENAKSFIALKTKDEEIKKLQGLVKKYKNELRYGGSAVLINQRSSYRIRRDCVSVVSNAVSRKGDSVFVYPAYKSDFNLDKWIRGNVLMNADSVKVDVKVRNEYEVLLVPGSHRWFKRQIAYIQIKDKNPYSEIEGIRSYQMAVPKQRRLGLGVFIGYGISSAGFAPVVGAGLNYTIIQF